MRLRPLIFGLVLALFGAFFIWSLFWFPYRPELIYGPIPPQAVVVSRHLELGPRWPAFSAHPLPRLLLRGAGVEEAAITAMASDPGVRIVLDRLAPRHTVFAHVSALGPRQSPAWVFTSWVGGQGQWMRWGAYRAALRDFEPYRFHGGRQGWVLRDAGPDFGNQSLALVITEGVLLGCLSDDPDALSVLIYRLENRVPPIPALRTTLQTVDDPDAPLDQVLLGTLNREAAPGTRDDGVWSLGWRLEPDGRATGSVQGPARGALGVGAAAPLDLTALGGLLGPSSSLLLVAPTHMLAAVPGGNDVGDAVRTLWRALHVLAPPGGQGFVSLCGADYSGRLMGIRVASVIAGMPIQDEARAHQAVAAALAAFNQRFDTTLQSRPRGSAGLATLQSARLGPLSALSDSERIAYQIQDGWLLIASHRAVLEKIWSRRHQSPLPAWTAPAPNGAPAASTLAWVDLAATGDALGRLLAALDLLSLAGAGAGDADPNPIREGLATVRTGASALRDLGQLRVRGQPDSAGRVTFLFELGPPL